MKSLFKGALASSFGKPGTLSFNITVWAFERDASLALPKTDVPPALTFKSMRQPTLPFYRWLHGVVGDPWLWWERKNMSDEVLASKFDGKQRTLLIAEWEGEPIGFAEIEFRKPESSHILFFGLRPEFTGRQLGPPMMVEALKLATVTKKIRKIDLTTCSLDSPGARTFYERMGFVETLEKKGAVHIPRNCIMLSDEQLQARNLI